MLTSGAGDAQSRLDIELNRSYDEEARGVAVNWGGLTRGLFLLMPFIVAVEGGSHRRRSPAGYRLTGACGRSKYGLGAESQDEGKSIVVNSSD